MINQMERKEIYTCIGSLIKKYRMRVGMSQGELAEAIEMTRTSVTNIESGLQSVQIHTLYNLSEVLDVDVFDLMPESGRIMIKIDDVLSAITLASNSGVEYLSDSEKSSIKRFLKTGLGTTE